MVEEQVEHPPNTFDESKVHTLVLECSDTLQKFEKLKKPYKRLVVEDVDAVHKMVEETYEVVNKTREFEEDYFEDDLPPDSFASQVSFKNFGYIGSCASQLEDYEDRLLKIHDLGEKLLQDDVFNNVAQVAVKHGDIYVSGGLMMRAMRGQIGEEFDYPSDIDALADCPIDKFGELAQSVIDSVSTNQDIEVHYSEKPFPKLSIRDAKNGGELINIVPAEEFANRSKKIASILGENLDDLSDIDITLVKWTRDRASQLALHIDGNLHAEIVNGGAPPIAINVFSENKSSYTGWRTIRKLYSMGAEDEANLLLRKSIDDVARFAKDVDKGTPLPTIYEKYLDGVQNFQVALAEYFLTDDNEYKGKVQSRAASNLVRTIGRDRDRLWELPTVGFDGLFSRTLIEARGYNLMEKGEEVGDRYVEIITQDKNEKGIRTAVGTVPLDILNDPAIYEGEDYCKSVTEYFAVIAGLTKVDDETLDKIAGEIDSNWKIKNGSANEIFDRGAFLNWSKDIRGAVSTENINYEYLVDFNDPETYYQEDDDPNGEKYLAMRQKVADAIHESNFWKERSSKFPKE